MNSMVVWKKLLNSIRNGIPFSDQNGSGFELFNQKILIDDFVHIDEPMRWLKTNGDFIYPSTDELKEALFHLRDEYGYTLGARLNNFGGINQLNYVVDLLKSRPESRKAIISFFDPTNDVMKSNLVSFLSAWFKIIDNKLTLTVTFRSVDVLLGFPANLYQTFLLLDNVAKKLNIEPGSITFNIYSAHYYDDDIIKKLI